MVRAGGERVAVHRDRSGNLDGLSARCAHMGCPVAFKAAGEAGSAPATAPASTDTDG